MSPLRSNPAGVSGPAAVGLLVALALPLFFVKLGGAGLVDPDEPYYAVPALEMLRSGTWAVPVFRGEPWFDKPVLFYWIVLAAFKTFGVSEWAARIGSALAGLGGALAVATLAPARWRRGGAHVLAAVVLATSLEYALLSRSAVTDMTLTFFITVGFLAVARHLESGSLGLAGIAGAAFGLATLTKGPVGVVVPAIALAGYGLASGRRELLASRPALAAATGFAVTAAPWYLYMLAAHRRLLLGAFLGQENWGRFVSAEHREVPLFYVWVLAAGLLPWSGALPAGLDRAVRDWRLGEDRAGASPGTVFALAWFAAVIAIFSISASKLSSYILPAFPAAAFLIADYWCEAFAPRPLEAPAMRDRRGAITMAAAAPAAGAILMLVAARSGRLVEARAAIDVLAAVLVASAVAAVFAVRRRRLAVFVSAQTAASLAIVLIAVWAWPTIESGASTKSLVAKLADRGLTDQLVGAYRVRDVSLEFYLGRPLLRETNAQELVRSVAAEPGRLWVVLASEAGRIASHVPVIVEPVMTVSRRAVVRLSPTASTHSGAP